MKKDNEEIKNAFKKKIVICRLWIAFLIVFFFVSIFIYYRIFSVVNFDLFNSIWCSFLAISLIIVLGILHYSNLIYQCQLTYFLYKNIKAVQDGNKKK